MCRLLKPLCALVDPKADSPLSAQKRSLNHNIKSLPLALTGSRRALFPSHKRRMIV